jgi:hypothetical protein
VAFTFVRGRESATGRQLADGECAWLDRGVNDDEPNSAQIFFEDLFVTTHFAGDGTLHRFQYSWRSGGSGQERPARMLLDAIVQRQSFVVHVGATGSGAGRYFAIRRVGP